MSSIYSASAKGFGGDVKVSVEVENGKLLSVSASGEKETAGIGDRALKDLPARIMKTGSARVDAVSGATVTSSAVLRAAEKALCLAGLSRPPEIKMKSGEYTGEGLGYDRCVPIKVRVKVSEDKIEDISFDGSGAFNETPPIFESAAQSVVSSIKKTQSLAVDAVTGATASSSGIVSAVRRALEKAIEARGGDKSAVSAFYREIPKTARSVELERDIVIAGMGGAGCAAAVSAAEEAKRLGIKPRILAIDCAGKYGGTAAVCGEMFAVNPPEHGKRYGSAECDRESLFDDWINKFTRGQCRREVVEKFLDESGRTVDWLSFEHGFILHTAMAGFGSDCPWKVKYQYMYDLNLEQRDDYPESFVPTERAVNVAQYFNRFVEDFRALGGEYMLLSECTELLYDKDARRVTGVRALGADGTEYTIKASQVILATGGFGGSGELEEKWLSSEYHPLKGRWSLYGMAQNRGAMLRSAIEQGAGTYNIGMVPCVHFTFPDGEMSRYPVFPREDYVRFTHRRDRWSANDLPGVLGTRKYIMQVGADGRRRFNEGGTFEFWKAGPRFYGIFGADLVDLVAARGIDGNPGELAKACLLLDGGYPCRRSVPDIYEILAAGEEAGFVFSGRTAQELAEKIGVPPEALADEIRKYNSYCRQGFDGDFGKDPSLLQPTALHGPYYAVRIRDLAYSTVAALDVDENIRVLDKGGSVMGGLYACGNDSGGVLYAPDQAYARYGGVALGWAFTSGRLAGISAARSLAGLL